MIKHRIRRGFPFLLGFAAESVKTAVIGTKDIAGKYDAGKQAFDLRHADTEEIEPGILTVTDGNNKTTNVKLEITNG